MIFTIRHNFKELPFFAILIKNQNGQIIADIYPKPTDTQNYLNFYQIQNCIKSIHYSLAPTICTIVTNKTLWPTSVEELRVSLNKSG